MYNVCPYTHYIKPKQLFPSARASSFRRGPGTKGNCRMKRNFPLWAEFVILMIFPASPKKERKNHCSLWVRQRTLVLFHILSYVFEIPCNRRESMTTNRAQILDFMTATERILMGNEKPNNTLSDPEIETRTADIAAALATTTYVLCTKNTYSYL